jgi:uncharacterized protein YacL
MTTFEIKKLNKMKKNSFTKLNDEALLKRINLFKVILNAIGIVYVLIIIVLLYLFFNKNFGQTSVAIFVPILVLPAVLSPILINYNLLKKERIGRNL